MGQQKTEKENQAKWERKPTKNFNKFLINIICPERTGKYLPSDILHRPWIILARVRTKTPDKYFPVWTSL